MKYFKLFLLTVIISQFNYAQIEEKPDKSLTGYWSGAMIRSGNSVQNMTAEIYKQGDSLVIGVSIPDWVYYPPKTSGFTFKKGSVVTFETYYGEASMVLDSSYLEMTGTIANANPPYQFHLKKSLKPFTPKILSKDIKVKNKGANVSGTLYYKEGIDKPMAAAVLVHGRGCGTRRWKQTRAQKLAEYGIAAFVYDKRGSQASGFPCEKATHDQNVSDINAIVKQLSKEKVVNKKKIGLVSYSAGSWIASHVTQVSEIPIAFLVTMVGPTTSVKQQQLDGLEAFMIEKGFEKPAIDEAKSYTELMFTEDDYKKAYEKMQELLIGAKEKGWDEWLVEDDYADSAQDIKNMWVQRFSYDPDRSYQRIMKIHILAVFAEKDPVVPYQKQIERLKQFKQEVPSLNVSTKIIPSAFHSMEHGPEVRDLGRDAVSEQPTYYYKYDRVAHGAIGYIVNFLDTHNFLAE